MRITNLKMIFMEKYLKNGIVVLSLFDGMSCGQIALKELGIKVDKYYASEIDKHAIKQTMLNFPDTIQLGSVTDVDVSKLDKIDFLIGGSPCTNFSFAGKRNGMSTTTKEEIYTLDRYLELKKEGFQFEGESFLFWEYIRILNDIRKYNPNVKFLLENVEMGKKWERTLSEAIGLFGVHINSALVSAQNRKRIYWTNIRTKQMGLFGHVYSDIPQPEDRGILLKDILDDGVEDKYYLNDDVIDKLVQHRERHKALGHGFGAKFHNKDEKMQALKVGGKGIDDLVCVAMRGRGENNEQQLEPNTFGKTNALTSVQKDNLIMQLNPSKESGGNQPYQQNRVYDINGIVPSLLAQMSCGAHKILVPYKQNDDNSINKHNEKRENKRRSCEILLALREEINSKKNVEREMAVYARFFKDEVLFKRMYEKFISESEVRSENYKEWEKPSSKKVTNCNVLNMQFENWDRCSSQRQKSIKQFIRQLAACMSELSQQNTSSKESMHYLWQTTKRVWVLRKALSEIQKIWEPICSETKPVQQSGRIRRLTPTEASRLQTIPEWYRWECSDTQAYRMLGNGWTVSVISHIFSYLPKEYFEIKE